MEIITRKARALQAQARKSFWGNLALLIIAIAWCGFGMIQFPATRLLFAFAFVWTAAGTYLLNRGLVPATMPGDAGLRSGAEFYRSEIGRRSTMIRRALIWSFAPTLLAIGTFILSIATGGNTFRKALPFITLVFVWVLAYFVVRWWEQIRLRRELDSLNSLDSDQSH